MKTLACALLLSSATFASHDDAWILVRDENAVTMHGDTRDIAAARKHLKDGPGYLWFRRDGRTYVVREETVLKEIEEASAPQEELGSEQSRLGQRQSKLGRQQGEFGRKQARRALEQARRDLDGEKGSAEDRGEQREMEKLQN